MKTLVLNSTNLNKSDSTNSEYIYKFPNAVLLNNEEISFGSMKVYYSWRNITASFSNNTLSYKWINGTTYTLTFVDGFYLISDLNSYLQSYLITNGHYLINDSGNYVYYLEITTNSTTYNVELRAYSIPTALPSGWTAPSGFVFPSTVKTAQFVVPSTNIQKIFGIYAGTYPSESQASSYVKTSDYVPQVSPIQSLFLSCSLLNNSYSYPTNILTSFTPDSTYGSLLNIESKALIFNDVQSGYYTDIRLRFLDQDYNPVTILDTNLVILLVIKNKNE